MAESLLVAVAEQGVAGADDALNELRLEPAEAPLMGGAIPKGFGRILPFGDSGQGTGCQKDAHVLELGAFCRYGLRRDGREALRQAFGDLACFETCLDPLRRCLTAVCIKSK